MTAEIIAGVVAGCIVTILVGLAVLRANRELREERDEAAIDHADLDRTPEIASS